MDGDAVTAWLLGAQRGDSEAAAAFVRATQADVWRFVAHLSSREAADDLTQETYLRAFRAAPSYRGDASARTWLLTIAQRVAADHLRQATRRPRFSAADVGAAAPIVTDAAGALTLRDLIDRLDAERRAAFVLTQILGFTYAETAAICGCPVGTVRSRVARAREDLAAWLREEPGGAVSRARRVRPV